MRQPKLLTTLKTYDRQQLGADLKAGVTVAMIALPLSLAIAIASGADPGTGLITAIIGGFFISALGGSRVQIGGPTGAFIVVVFGIIAEHGYDGLVLATLMAGVLLLLAGALRAGRLVALVPEPVINGFTIGIAIIIATSQIKTFLGLELAQEPADFLEKMPALWGARGTLSLSTLCIGLASMALIVVLRRAGPRQPGLIVAVAITSALVALFGLPVETLHSRFGALPTALPAPAWPDLSVDRLIELLPSAVIIAVLAAIESLLSAIVADRMIEGSHRPNAELLAQGVANSASALFGGLPVTGAIARTATNVRAGGQTPMAGIFHALTILIVMLVAGPAAEHLAMPALAALLMLTAWNMSEPDRWASYAKAPWPDRVLLLITLALTVLVDLTIAIGVGVALDLLLRRLRARR